jgi:tetratricopeptide (TPR) repeat protein
LESSVRQTVEKGNQEHRRGNHQQAVKLYSRGIARLRRSRIALDPRILLNRATSYSAMAQWDMAPKDAGEALELLLNTDPLPIGKEALELLSFQKTKALMIKARAENKAGLVEELAATLEMAKALGLLKRVQTNLDKLARSPSPVDSEEPNFASVAKKTDSQGWNRNDRVIYMQQGERPGERDGGSSCGQQTAPQALLPLGQ